MDQLGRLDITARFVDLIFVLVRTSHCCGREGQGEVKLPSGRA